MNVFQTHSEIVSDYATYIRSFLRIADPVIRDTVEKALKEGKLWPEPLLQFNPSFEMFGSLDDLAKAGEMHPDIRDIFKGYSLYRHQVEAIRLGISGKDFIITSGTLPENDRVRYTISPAARKEVLKRLLAENHRRAAVQAKNDSSAATKKKGKNKSVDDDVNRKLF